jgi:uncharacterized membrane protein YbhN (UPF0104 family)
LKSYVRIIALVILAAVTAVGLQQFFASDWKSVLDYWQLKLAVLPIVLALACTDVALEAIGWMWVYERLGVRAMDARGVQSYLAGRAGLPLPAQLGRLIRPDAMTRLGRGSMVTCAKAEAVAFILDCTSVVALLVGLGTYMFYPLGAVPATAATLIVIVFLGDRLACFAAGTSVEIPRTFWWNWRTFAIILIEMAGWAAHGLALFVLIRDISAAAGVVEAMFYAPACAVLGVGTGLPGGVGATESLLGVSLHILEIPTAHLALTIAAFRVLTFWIWIPVGWLGLVAVQRNVEREPAQDAVDSPVEEDAGFLPST